MGPTDMPYQSMNDDHSPRGYQDFSPSIEGNLISRKRTYSMSEGLPNAFMQPPFSQHARPSSVGGWPVQTPTKDPSQHPHGEGHTMDMYSTPPLANGSGKVTQPFWTQERTAPGQQAGM